MRKAEKLAIKASKAYRKHNKFLQRYYELVLRTIFACDYSGKVNFDPTAQLVHNGLGVVFHPKTVVGPNCKIYQNVTLGGNGKLIDGKKVNSGGPTLEKNVAVFSGACVLGPITIGHDSIIGANAVVTHDVPPNSLVSGNPAIVKERKFDYDFS